MFSSEHDSSSKYTDTSFFFFFFLIIPTSTSHPTSPLDNKKTVKQVFSGLLLDCFGFVRYSLMHLYRTKVRFVFEQVIHTFSVLSVASLPGT